MKVYFGGGQGKRLARKEILQTVGWANTFSLAEGLKVRRRRWKVSSPVARECIEMCTFNCFESIEISLFPLISSRLYSTVRFTFQTFILFYPYLANSITSHIFQIVSRYIFSHCFIFYFIKFLSFFNSHRIIRLIVKLRILQFLYYRQIFRLKLSRINCFTFLLVSIL